MYRNFGENKVIGGDLYKQGEGGGSVVKKKN